MSIPGLLQVALYVVLLILITRLVGTYMWRVFAGERTFLNLVFASVERVIYRLTGVNANEEHGWRGYASAMLLFSVVGGLLTYAIERLQHVLPFNPQGLDSVPADLAFNTAMSFTT